MISILHECVARVKMLIFSPHEMKYICIHLKKVKFLFILYSTEIQEAQSNFSFDLTFAGCFFGITLGVNIVCTKYTRCYVQHSTLPKSLSH